MKAIAMIAIHLVWMGMSMALASSGNQENSPQSQAYKTAYGLVLEGKWSEADEALAGFLRTHRGSKWTDDAEFWRCYIASRQASDKEKAFACFESFVKNYPKSSYRKDAQSEMVTLARDLVKAGKPEYEDKVRKLRQSQEKETTLMVLSALRDIGDEQAWNALLDYYKKSDDERIRKSIVSMLDDFKGVKASQELMKIYQQESSEVLRKEAIRNLRSFKHDEKVMSFLKEIVLDRQTDMGIRRTALRGLGSFEDQNLVAFFEKVALEGSKELALSAVRQIGDAKHNASWEILHRIYEKSTDLNVRRRVLATMGDELGRRSLDFLTEVATQSDSIDLRRSAIRALADVKDESVLSRLENIIDKASESDTRKYGIRSMGDLRGEQVKLALINYLTTHRDSSTRKEAAYALGESAKKDAIPYLKKSAIEDNSSDVRRAAIRAIKDIGDVDAAKVLIEILESQKNR